MENSNIDLESLLPPSTSGENDTAAANPIAGTVIQDPTVKAAKARANLAKPTETDPTDFLPHEGVNSGTIPMSRPGTTNVSEYLPYMKSGVYSDKNIDLERAQNQSFTEQLAKGLVNIVPNIATAIGGSVGELGTMFQFGDDRTYSNALTETMAKWHDPFGQVYQEHPEQTADLKDPAWWIKQGTGLVEMAGQFAALGGGVGSLFEKGALAIGDAIGSARIARALLKGGQVATSMALSYTIGAQMGSEVFKKAYDTNFNRLLSLGYNQADAHAQAQHVASQAAASTVQLNTALGFGLNLTSVLPVFKQSDEVIDFLQNGAGKRLTGESLGAYKNRLQSLTADSPEIAEALGIQSGADHLMEGLKQGTEGAVMEFSKRAGERQGESGKTKGYIEQFDELGNLLDDATSGQGILNAVLGVAGGVLNTAVLGRIPLHKDFVRENGDVVPLTNPDGSPKVDAQGREQYQTKMYSSRDMSRNQRYNYFENARDSIIHDIDHIQSSTEKLQALGLAGKHDEAQKELNDLLAVQQLHSITMGTSENLAAEYDSIASADNSKDLGAEAGKQADAIAEQQKQLLQQAGVDTPDKLPDEAKPQYEQLDQSRKEALVQSVQLANTSEAMQKGLTKSMGDNSYQQRASEAGQDLKTYTKWHGELSRTFGYDPRNQEAHVPEQVLHKMIQAHLYDRLITNIDTETTRKRDELRDMHGPVLSTDKFNSLIGDYNSTVSRNQQVGNKFNDELATLHDALKRGDKTQLEAMLSKYRIDYANGEEHKAAVDLSYKLAGLRELKYAQAKDAHQKIADSLEFKTWSDENPDKTLPDYIKELEKRTITNEALNARQAYSDQLKAERDILRGEINKITARPKRYADSVLKDFEKYKQKLTERIQAENLSLHDQDRELAAADKLTQKQVDNQRRVLGTKIDDLEKQITDHEDKISKMVGTEERNALGKLTRWVRDPLINKARKELTNMQAQLDFLKAKLIEVTDPVVSPEQTLANERINAIPNEIEETINEWAAKISSDLSPNEIKSQILQELTLKGIDPKTITGESVDAVVVRAMTSNRTANEKDAGETVDGLNSLIANTGNPTLVREVVDEILADPAKFNYKALDMHTLMGFLDTNQAAKILSKVEDLINGESHTTEVNTTQPVEEEIPQPKVTETPDNDEVDVPEPEEEPLPIPDPSPDPVVVGRNTAKDTKPVFHLGAKATSAVRINRLDVDYLDQVDEDGNYNLTSSSATINRKNSEDMLVHGKIVPGTQVKFVVDTEWKGTKNSDQAGNQQIQDSFDLYQDKDGKIPNAQNLIDEVPIKIVNEKGETLGYLPRIGWILAKYEGAQNYRNIAENETTSPEEEATKLRAVRAQVVNFFNSGSSDISTTVSERGPGHLIMNVDEKGGIKPESATKMLPASDLEMGIIDHGAVRTSKTTTSSKEINPSQADSDWMQNDNAPVVVVPMPGGDYSTAPLFNRSLEPHEHKTMLELIRAYLAGDEKVISKVQELTNFDISTAEGLRNLINQHYTYTNRFAESVLKPSMDAGATPKFLFNISNETGSKKGEISLGYAYSGGIKRVATLLPSGELSPEFVDNFMKGMKGRFKNIVFEDNQRGLKGLNSKGSLNEIVFSNRVIKVRKEHTSYNDYVKSFSETPVNGMNKLSTGEYVYGVHASTNLDMASVMQARPDGRAEAKIPDSSIEVGKVYDPWDPRHPEYEAPKNSTFSADDAALLDGGFMDFSPVHNAPGVTLESLRDLHTFTPEESHNGKTPEEVVAEMQRAGLDHIPENFNPFLKC